MHEIRALRGFGSLTALPEWLCQILDNYQYVIEGLAKSSINLTPGIIYFTVQVPTSFAVLNSLRMRGDSFASFAPGNFTTQNGTRVSPYAGLNSESYLRITLPLASLDYAWRIWRRRIQGWISECWRRFGGGSTYSTTTTSHQAIGFAISGQSTSTSSWWLSHFVVKSLRFTCERDVSEMWYRMLYQVRVSLYIIGWTAHARDKLVYGSVYHMRSPITPGSSSIPTFPLSKGIYDHGHHYDSDVISPSCFGHYHHIICTGETG